MPKKLRAARSQKSYKRIDAYLRQVYKQNKDYLDEYIANPDNKVIERFGSYEETFKKVVMDIWKEKEWDKTLGRRIRTYDEAIDKAQRSGLITRSRHYQELVYDEISEDKVLYRQLRNIIGRAKFSPENITYEGEADTEYGHEKWYELKYNTYEKDFKIATRGKRAGLEIEYKKKVEKTYYIVFYESIKSGGGGFYSFVPNKPDDLILKD